MSDVLIRESVEEAKVAPAADRLMHPAATDDRLNWDEAIEAPPARPHGTIRVTLECAGRSTPVPVDDPWAE